MNDFFDVMGVGVEVFGDICEAIVLVVIAPFILLLFILIFPLLVSLWCIGKIAISLRIKDAPHY